MKDNESAVSPIVATLVLIVVAVVGAVAVGTIMGTFSSDVADQNNAGDVAGASATEILVVGSTTVQPASEALAKEYMKLHPGIKITVQGGGSGAGVTAAGEGIADLGSASRNVKSTELEEYPLLQEHQIGGSAVVIICNEDLNLANVTENDIREAYVNDNFNGTLATASVAVARAESSGTQDTFVEWLGIDADTYHADVETATGNGGVVAEVADTTGAIGFCDWGYADASGIEIVDLAGYDPVDADAIVDALGGDNTAYPVDLTRGLFYITNGEAGSIVKNYIQFAQSPNGAEILESDNVGMFGFLSL